MLFLFLVAIDVKLHTVSTFFRCSALGTKRLASEELVYDLDNKRLNVGPVRILFLLLLSDPLTTALVFHLHRLFLIIFFCSYNLTYNISFFTDK